MIAARLAALVVRRPRATLLVALAVGALALPAALRLRLDTNLVDLLPAHTPRADSFARFTRAFGGEQVLVVLLQSDDGARLIPAAEALAGALRDKQAYPRLAGEVAEVRYRLSGRTAELLRDHLLDLLDDAELDELGRRVQPAELRARASRLRGILAAPGGSALAPLLTSDPLQLLEVVGQRLQAGLPVDTTSGYYRSADGKALLLFVKPTFDPFEIERDRALLAALTEAARRVIPCAAPFGEAATGCAAGLVPVEVGFTGAYAYALAYRDWLHRDMEISTVVSVVAVLLFFGLLLGAVRALPAVAPALLYGLWLTGAAAGGIYGRVNAVSLSFGTILISIGIDLPIQIYNRLREELRSRPPREAIEHTMATLAGPALLATLGPAVVFAACALSRYQGLAELGVLAGLPRAVLALVALACLALLPLAARVHVERRLISVEPPSMAPARVNREVQRRFGGGDEALVVLSGDADPERALEASDRWRARADRLRRAGLLASYESVSSLFPSAAEVARRRARVAALDPQRIARELRAALEEAGFDAAPFEPFLDRLVRPPPPLTPAEAGPELAFLVSAHIKDRKGPPAERLVTTLVYPAPGRVDEAVAALTREEAAAPGDGELTGKPLLEQALREVIERDTVKVTLASVAAVVLLLVVYYRRVRPVLAVLLPLTAAWILFAAALGGLDLPLNVFNLLTVPLVVGYGIDDHVFLVHRFEEAPALGPARALASTGRAIVVTSLSTMAGFAGLAVARFDGLRLLGLAGTLAVALCLLAALAVLPALLPVIYGPGPAAGGGAAGDGPGAAGDGPGAAGDGPGAAG